MKNYTYFDKYTKQPIMHY